MDPDGLHERAFAPGSEPTILAPGSIEDDEEMELNKGRNKASTSNVHQASQKSIRDFLHEDDNKKQQALLTKSDSPVQVVPASSASTMSTSSTTSKRRVETTRTEVGADGERRTVKTITYKEEPNPAPPPRAMPLANKSTRTITRTTIRPDGTKITTITNVDDNSHTTNQSAPPLTAPAARMSPTPIAGPTQVVPTSNMPTPTTIPVSNGGDLVEPIHELESVVRFYENIIPQDFPPGHEEKFAECMRAINVKCDEFEHDMPGIGYATCIGCALGLTIILAWLPRIIIEGQVNAAVRKLSEGCNQVLQHYNSSYWEPNARIQMWFTAEDLPNTDNDGLRRFRIHWKRI